MWHAKPEMFTVDPLQNNVAKPILERHRATLEALGAAPQVP